MDMRMDIIDVDKAKLSQALFTAKNSLERFSPDDGICEECGEQIYESINVEDAARYQIIACPVCGESFEG